MAHVCSRVSLGALVAALVIVSPAGAVGGDPLLSGYAGPGGGDQAVLGSDVLPGRNRAGNGGRSRPVSLERTSEATTPPADRALPGTALDATTGSKIPAGTADDAREGNDPPAAREPAEGKSGASQPPSSRRGQDSSERPSTTTAVDYPEPTTKASGVTVPGGALLVAGLAIVLLVGTAAVTRRLGRLAG